MGIIPSLKLPGIDEPPRHHSRSNHDERVRKTDKTPTKTRENKQKSDKNQTHPPPPPRKTNVQSKGRRTQSIARVRVRPVIRPFAMSFSAMNESSENDSFDARSIGARSDATNATNRADDVNAILNYVAKVGSRAPPVRGEAIAMRRVTEPRVMRTNEAYDDSEWRSKESSEGKKIGEEKGKKGFDANALLAMINANANGKDLGRMNEGKSDRVRRILGKNDEASNASNETEDDGLPEYSFMMLKGNANGARGRASDGKETVSDASPASVAQQGAMRTQRGIGLRREALRQAGVDVDAVEEESPGSGSARRPPSGARAPAYPSKSKSASDTNGSNPLNGTNAFASDGANARSGSMYETSYETYKKASTERPGRSASGGSVRERESVREPSSDQIRIQYQQGDAEDIQSLKDHRRGNLLRSIGELANKFLNKVTGFKVVPTYPLDRRITRCVVGDGLSI